jgi:hypothetical protein
VDRFSDSRYLLARFLAIIPPEVPGAMILLALLHPGLVAAVFAILFAAQMVIVKVAAVAITFVLKYVAGLIIGGIITWYLEALLKLHVWPRLPRSLQEELLKLKGLMLFACAAQDQASTRDEGTDDPRNQERGPRR